MRGRRPDVTLAGLVRRRCLSGASGFVGDAGKTLNDAAPRAAEIRALVADRLERVESLFRENVASPLSHTHAVNSPPSE